MRKLSTFTMRISEDEKRLLSILALRVGRSKADVIRHLVIQAIREPERLDLKPIEAIREGQNVTE